MFLFCLRPLIYLLCLTGCGAFLYAEPSGEDLPIYRQIDQIIGKSLADAGLTPAAISSDAEFVRRIYLDLNGVIPTALQAATFLDDPSADKRQQLIETLLASPEYAIHFARVFDVMLLERRTPAGGTSLDVPPASWLEYLTEAFAENRPWDIMAGEILGGDGTDERRSAAVRFYLARDVNPHQLTRDIGRLFLGIDLQCAQCHDDPRFKDYLQADYYGLYAFLERTKLHPVKPKGALLGELAVSNTQFTSVFTAESGETNPRLPGGGMIADPPLEKDKEYLTKPESGERGIPVYSRRLKLSEELPRTATRGFAGNLANRMWALLLGRGIIHPLDLRHAANPPSHPELLDLLESWLIDHHYDIKGLLREITLSQTYQRSSVIPEGVSSLPEEAFAVAPLRGLTAEQFRWSVLQATGRIEAHLAMLDSQPSKSEPGTSPSWKRKLEHLDALARQSSALMSVFAGLPGQPEAGFQPTVDQALHLMNSPKLIALLNAKPDTAIGRPLSIAESGLVVEELYLSVLARRPTSGESSAVSLTLEQSGSSAEKSATLNSLRWGLLLSAEFRLNH